ncbi:MAG: thiamine phosphate synthase [Dongiaceae bacterium]
MSEPHACRLFVRLPAGPALDRALDSALSDPDVASLLLPAGLQADDVGRAAVRRIQAAEHPALVIDDLDLRAALQADGVHLTDPSAIRAARANLGHGLVVGAECPLERHACMVAAEDGADYVAVRVTADSLEAAEELLAWWHEMMTIPIVAFADLPEAAAYKLRLYADFLSPSVADAR